MRKFVVVGLAALGVFAVVGIAYASNTYTSTSKVTPSSTGTSARPKPVASLLTFKVSETTAGNRPSSLTKARVGLGPGVQPFTGVAKGCPKPQATGPFVSAACDKLASRGGSQVGNGLVNALAGPIGAVNNNQKCFLYVRLLASTRKNHLWIRVDGRPTPGLQAPFPTSVRGKTCPVSQSVGFDATFLKVGTVARRGGGTLPSYELRFTVPDNLVHPILGYESSVVENVTSISRVSKRIRGVNHGFVESIGCPKSPAGFRSAKVTYTSAAGQTTSTTSKSKCS